MRLRLPCRRVWKAFLRSGYGHCAIRGLRIIRKLDTCCQAVSQKLKYVRCYCSLVPRSSNGFCRCFAFQIGKICYHHCIIRHFQFRKCLPVNSNNRFSTVKNISSCTLTAGTVLSDTAGRSLPALRYPSVQTLPLLCHLRALFRAP